MSRFVVAACTFLMCLCIATPLAPPVHAQSSTSPTLDRHAHNIFDNADAPGIAIVEFDRNGVTAERYFGVDGHNNPITRDTPFIWGSISKSFTAVLIMQLEEQGTISLDDPITKYFPEFEGTAFGNNGATITNMLQHTSGLTALPKMISDPQANAVIDEVSHLKSVNPLGTWEYNSHDYMLLQILIERVTHTPSYSDYLNEHIGKISDSSPLLADVDSVVNDVPPGYAFFFGTLRSYKTHGIYPQSFGAGGISGSAVQLARYGAWQLRQHQEHALPSMLPRATGAKDRDETVEYGPGLQYSTKHTSDGAERQIVSHTGGQPGGFFTRLEFSPETGKGTVLLVNRLDLVSTSGKKQNEPIAAYLNDYFDIVDKKAQETPSVYPIIMGTLGSLIVVMVLGLAWTMWRWRRKPLPPRSALNTGTRAALTLLAGGGFSLAIYKGMPLMFGFTSLIDTAWFTPDGALLGWILIAVTLLFTGCVVARSLYWAARNKQAQPTP